MMNIHIIVYGGDWSKIATETHGTMNEQLKNRLPFLS
jgi:hypothetical protein